MDGSMYPLGTREAFERHMDDAKYAKWFRNAIGLGILAATAITNFTTELSRGEHIISSASGVALAGITAGMLELARRDSIKKAVAQQAEV